MAKSGMDRAGDLAQAAKALKDIIQAAMRGGWQAAALEAAKHFWPYILAAAVVLLLLPVIIYCCLPSMLFGFSGSADPEIMAMNAKADAVKGYYEQYETYCAQRVEEIKTTVMNGNQNGESTTPPLPAGSMQYEVLVEGAPLEKDWFITLYSVRAGNDLRNMSESGVKEFVVMTIPYTVTDKAMDTSSPGTDSEVTQPPAPTPVKLLTITHQTSLQILEHYSESDRNWAQLLYKTLKNGTGTAPGPGIPGSGEMASPFPGTDWRDILTSGYGSRIDPITGNETEFHKGLDLARPMGTNIYAAKAGVVSLVRYNTTGYGYHVMIDHGDGLQTLYGHCSALLVTEGQHVEQGQLIAQVGSTGNSTGPHCHFEVRVNTQHVDPRNYLP